MDGNVMNELRKEMMDFNNSSTVVRFTADNPLPKKLIKKLVLARIEEIDQKLAKKTRNDSMKTKQHPANKVLPQGSNHSI